jgi:predicted regulator of Ras-like GTPase activity (Roadblock/LC7/MglB family)/regulator of replication initiation timing
MSSKTDQRVKRFLSEFRQNNPGIGSLAVFSDLGVVISEGKDFNRNEFRIAQISSVLLSTVDRKEVETELGEIIYSITSGEKCTLVLFSIPKNYSIFVKFVSDFGDYNLLLYRLKVLALKLKHVFSQQTKVDPIDEINGNLPDQDEFIQPDTESLDAMVNGDDEAGIDIDLNIDEPKKEPPKIDQQLESAKQDIKDIMQEKVSGKVDEVVYEHMKLRVENALLKQKLKEKSEGTESSDVEGELQKVLDDAKNQLLDYVKTLVIKD